MSHKHDKRGSDFTAYICTAAFYLTAVSLSSLPLVGLFCTLMTVGLDFCKIILGNKLKKRENAQLTFSCGLLSFVWKLKMMLKYGQLPETHCLTAFGSSQLQQQGQSHVHLLQHFDPESDVKHLFC